MKKQLARMHRNNRLLTSILIFGDLASLYAALFLALSLRYTNEMNQIVWKQHFRPFTIIFFAWIAVLAASELYNPKLMKNHKRFFYLIIKSLAAGVVIAIIVFYLVPAFGIEPRRNLIIISTLALGILSTWRYLINQLIIKSPSSKVIFLGINKEVVELADYLLSHPQLKQRPMAFVSVDGEEKTSHLPLPHFARKYNIPHITSEKNIRNAVQELETDTVVITREIKENKTLVKMLFETIPLGVTVVEFSAYYESFTGKVPASLIGEIWFLENLVGGRRRYYSFFKRGMDLTLAAILTVPSALLFPFAALAIKLDSDGPVFFKQKRVGRNGKIFELIKFRSMIKDAEKMSGAKGKGRDERHTRVGAFLRKSYLDEIPQIINVIRGEVSFIGPRPERPEHVENLKQKIPFYEMRLLIQPGITGWAQINMENDASVEDAPEKMQYDLYYIKNRSLILDLLIALRTILAILRRQGR